MLGSDQIVVPKPFRVCFISHQYPPSIGGGIGRFTADLAAGFAAAGHDVHVITTQGGWPALASRDGVWVHRISGSTLPNAIEGEAAASALSNIALVYREIVRMHKMQPFDIVSSPIWLAEGLLIGIDSRFVSVVSLHTSTRTLRDIDPGHRNRYTGLLEILEAECIEAHVHTHANSNAAVVKIAGEYSMPKGVVVLPHGVGDQSGRFVRTRRNDDRVRVLVVGRHELRKGADAYE